MVQRTSIGLDVHARSVVACALDQVTGELWEKRFGREPDRLVDWVKSLPGPVLAAYEAGPTGFGLARRLVAEGVACQVVAPSKLLPVPGDRVKTDRRDARHLCELVAAGLTTPVRVPDPAEEEARDVVRAREDARGDLMRARHRLSKLLLRHDVVWDGKATWGKTHMRWLASQRFDSSALQAAFDNDLAAVRQVEARRDELDTLIVEMAAGGPYATTVAALGCLRGVSTLTGYALAVEIGDWSRFTGRTIGSFVGLVPSERSSGQTRSQGGVTKTGNAHVRRLLVEAAWHHRRPYRGAHASPVLEARQALAPAPVRVRAEVANRRLARRWAGFDARGKKPAVANAAIARELAGHVWTLAMMAT